MKRHLLLVFPLVLLLSCATAAPIPDWAQSPTDTYIAQRGRGQTREAAETAAAHNSRGEKGRI